MGFHNDLSLASRNITEQTSKSGLGSWMQMYFWLLKQQQVPSITAQNFGQYRQYLANPISDVGQVAIRDLDPILRQANFNLEWHSVGRA